MEKKKYSTIVYREVSMKLSQEFKAVLDAVTNKRARFVIDTI